MKRTTGSGADAGRSGERRTGGGDGGRAAGERRPGEDGPGAKRSQERPLEGKVVGVTGAGRGIGRAIAVGMADAGARVGCAARTAAELEETVAAIEADGGTGLALPTDVTDLGSVERAMSRLEREWGGLDILFINAGGNFSREELDGSDPASWRETIDVNLVGAYHCARAAIPLLKRRGAGKIITTGSGMGHRGTTGRSAYACAKAGLWMLVRVLARELAPWNITVNEIIPGPVETIRDPELLERWRKGFREMGEWIKQPADVVPLALFLATQPHPGPSAQSFSLMRRDN